MSPAQSALPKKKRILVVDDKTSDSQLVKSCLEQTDHYVVREENDPKKAMTTALEFRPHLILLDVRMPGMDGGELAACILANPKLSAVPIVFLTALVTKSEIAAGNGRSGKYPMLAKPIVLRELIACVKQCLVTSAPAGK
jgi:CheY-like chemotaxis protein